jgi:glyoxylase-like metal-dependent hydrolase (beta-lactamase superfamily II)
MTFRRRAGPLGSVTKPARITYVVLLTTVSLSETALGVGRMGPPHWLPFVERPFPSSNIVVIAGDKPVLVDTGYGSDLARTEGLLAERGIGPADLSLVVNSDHVGGNAGLRGRPGPRPTGTPPIPGPETGRPPKRRRNGPTGTVARIRQTTRKEKGERVRGPADRGVFRRARRR